MSRCNSSLLVTPYNPPTLNTISRKQPRPTRHLAETALSQETRKTRRPRTCRLFHARVYIVSRPRYLLSPEKKTSRPLVFPEKKEEKNALAHPGNPNRRAAASLPHLKFPEMWGVGRIKKVFTRLYRDISSFYVLSLSLSLALGGVFKIFRRWLLIFGIAVPWRRELRALGAAICRRGGSFRRGGVIVVRGRDYGLRLKRFLWNFFGW